MTLRYRIYLGNSKDFIESYFSSLEEDKVLAKYAATVMLAHVKALVNQGILSKDLSKDVLATLIDIIKTEGETLYKWITEGNYHFEDVFEALEAYLHEVVGINAGYIAIGRSRNDHIAAVLRLYTRDRAVEVLQKLLELRKVFLDKATEFRGIIIPYFTHGQVAQCGSASIYFASYEQTFSNIWRLLAQGFEMLSENPLGSGAASGSLLNLDRSYIAKTLCFSDGLSPPYYSTGSRLFALYYLNMLSLLMLEISRFAEDMLLLSSLIPNSINPPVDHVATSSIMPHKRNLVTMEIARARASKVLGYALASQSIYKGLPYGYNLDLQEINMLLKQVFDVVTSTLNIVIDFVSRLSVNSDAFLKYVSDKPCWSSELVEYIAITNGKPVREVYLAIAKLFKNCNSVDEKCISKVLSAFGLNAQDIWNIVKGKPIEVSIKKLLEDAWTKLERDRNTLKNVIDVVEKCTAELLSYFS
jgi:argininosuccinate lyase